MNIKKLALFLSALLVSCVFCNNSFAQSQTRSRAIYGELLGASQGIGFNYDARFKKDASDGFGWRTGLGFGYAYSSIFAAYNIDGEKIDTYNQMFRLSVPVEVNYLLGKGNSKFEAGAGAALCADLYTSASGAKPASSFGRCNPLSESGISPCHQQGFPVPCRCPSFLQLQWRQVQLLSLSRFRLGFLTHNPMAKDNRS